MPFGRAGTSLFGSVLGVVPRFDVVGGAFLFIFALGGDVGAVGIVVAWTLEEQILTPRVLGHLGQILHGVQIRNLLGTGVGIVGLKVHHRLLDISDDHLGVGDLGLVELTDGIDADRAH